MTLSAISLVLLFAFVGGSLAEQCPKITTQKNFNLKKFMGDWYINYLVLSPLKSKSSCDNATYTLNCNGTITMLNQGINDQGEYGKGLALATIVNPKYPGSWRVVSENGDVAGFNVLATDYENYACDYDCTTLPDTGERIDFAYVLSRKKTLGSDKLQKAIDAFARIGVDVSKFYTVPQNC